VDVVVTQEKLAGDEIAPGILQRRKFKGIG